jgi:hypothetical protein
MHDQLQNTVFKKFHPHPADLLLTYSLSALQGDRQEMDDERKHKRIAEGVAAAAVGYGLYEHHQKSEAEDKLEELGYDSDGNKKKEHHLFG